MDIQMRLYWEAFSEFVNTSEIVKKFHNPVREYEDELIDGAIIDIGCGQTSFLLDYFDSGRKLIGIDNEQFQLNKLKTRLEELGTPETTTVSLKNLTLLQDTLPKETYSVVFFANILHFFNIVDCRMIITQLEANLVSGSLVYVCVHSEKFHTNNPDDPDNHDYFKHYFSLEDVDGLFTKENYQRMYFADMERSDSAKEKEIKAVWLEKYMDQLKIPKGQRVALRKEHLVDDLRNDLIFVYKRK